VRDGEVAKTRRPDDVCYGGGQKITQGSEVYLIRADADLSGAALKVELPPLAH
jgi:hypothetical protein